MTKNLRISVIIPCLNEEDNLKELLPFLLEYGIRSQLEIIVVDGGSKDNSISIAESFGVKVIKSAVGNRAKQLNIGARHAQADIYYFVHADTRPAKAYFRAILESVSSGKEVGCFRYRFDSESAFLKINSWLTRYNGFLSGGGDQSLFIKQQFFDKLGGFDESFCIMEDFDLVRRIRLNSRFHILADEMTVSARKYSENSYMKVQLANFMAFSLFLLKVKPASIKSLYLNFLNKRIKSLTVVE